MGGKTPPGKPTQFTNYTFNNPILQTIDNGIQINNYQLDYTYRRHRFRKDTARCLHLNWYAKDFDITLPSIHGFKRFEN